jgi:hypothetical protein
MEMILLTSIPNRYIKEIDYEFLNELGEKYSLYVIGNRKEIGDRIGVEYNHIEYDRYVWSYVDKIFYAFKLSYELNQGVLWVDADKLHRTHFYNNTEEHLRLSHILYEKLWDRTTEDIFINPKNNKQWIPFYEFVKTHGVDPLKIKLIIEDMFYLPLGVVTKEMIVDIDLGRSVVEYGSFLAGYPYRDEITGDKKMGNGEGLLLGFIIEKYGLLSTEFDRTPFRGETTRTIEKPKSGDQTNNNIRYLI